MPWNLSAIRLRSGKSWARLGHHQHRGERGLPLGVPLPRAQPGASIMLINILSSLEEISLSCSGDGPRTAKLWSVQIQTLKKTAGRGFHLQHTILFQSWSKSHAPPENAPGSSPAAEAWSRSGDLSFQALLPKWSLSTAVGEMRAPPYISTQLRKGHPAGVPSALGLESLSPQMERRSLPVHALHHYLGTNSRSSVRGPHRTTVGSHSFKVSPAG